MELYKGRPDNTNDRLPREVRTYDFLDELGIEYERTDHERADNMEACNEIDAVLGVIICKNLFLSAHDAGRQEVQDKGTIGTDQFRKAVVRRSGRYAEIS